MGMASGKTGTGRHRDPMFWCLVGAMILAIGSSVTLRMVVRNAGPSAARAETTDEAHRPARTPATEPGLQLRVEAR